MTEWLIGGIKNILKGIGFFLVRNIGEALQRIYDAILATSISA